MSILDGNWIEVMKKIHLQELREEDIKFSNQASVILYLVSPEYAIKPGNMNEKLLFISSI